MSDLTDALDRMPLHFPIGVRDLSGYDPDDQECVNCGEDWPCPTSRLIDAARAAAFAETEGDTDAG